MHAAETFLPARESTILNRHQDIEFFTNGVKLCFSNLLNNDNTGRIAALLKHHIQIPKGKFVSIGHLGVL